MHQNCKAYVETKKKKACFKPSRLREAGGLHEAAPQRFNIIAQAVVVSLQKGFQEAHFRHHFVYLFIKSYKLWIGQAGPPTWFQFHNKYLSHCIYLLKKQQVEYIFPISYNT